MKMKLMIFLCLICSFFTMAAATTFDSGKMYYLVSFGDSLSDVGNNTWTHPDIGSQTGEQTIQGAPLTNPLDLLKLSGATTNRPLWLNDLVTERSDIFANEIILTSSVIGTASPNNQNVDYAWAGTESGNYYTDQKGDNPSEHLDKKTCAQRTTCTPGLLMQVNNYLKQVPHPPKNTLFTLWAGANDVFDNLPNVVALKLSTRQLQDNIVDNLVSAAEKLKAAGVPADHIIVFTLPDISKTPVAGAIRKGIKNKVLAQIEIDILKAILMGNKYGLPGVNQKLRDSLSGTRIQLVDANKIFEEIAKSKTFSDTSDSCIINNQVAAGCTGYLYYDLVHPTTEAGAALAKQISDRF